VIPPRASVVVFAKAPVPGAVKTRMCPPLLPAQAAELASAMLADVLEATAAMAARLHLRPLLAVHPPDRRGALARDVPTPFGVISQRGSNLAARMAWAVREAAATGAPRVLLRGSDSPTLDLASLAAALDALDAADVVLRPDLDGGYNLVGLRRAEPRLFDHPMSTPRVLEDTCARASELSLSVALLPPGFDVDTARDLALLARDRARAAPLCARTLAFLDRNRLWRHAVTAC
jgi:rSAM/selenodomain-associated transferase 1